MNSQERHRRLERLLDSTILTQDKARVIFTNFNAVDVNEVPVLLQARSREPRRALGDEHVRRRVSSRRMILFMMVWRLRPFSGT